jgi:hypothetical protein
MSEVFNAEEERRYTLRALLKQVNQELTSYRLILASMECYKKSLQDEYDTLCKSK